MSERSTEETPSVLKRMRQFTSPFPEADMNRQDICDNPLFKDLPFKFETDRWGHIVMSPATNKHSWLQGEILNLLRQHLPDGRVLPKCSIQTSEGVKVADAVWARTVGCGDRREPHRSRTIEAATRAMRFVPHRILQKENRNETKFETFSERKRYGPAD